MSKKNVNRGYDQNYSRDQMYFVEIWGVWTSLAQNTTCTEIDVRDWVGVIVLVCRRSEVTGNAKFKEMLVDWRYCKCYTNLRLDSTITRRLNFMTLWIWCNPVDIDDCSNFIVGIKNLLRLRRWQVGDLQSGIAMWEVAQYYSALFKVKITVKQWFYCLLMVNL